MESKIVLCTGANRGLGYSIVEQTALREPSSTYLVASRDLSNGHAAAAKLREAGVTARLEVLELEVENDQHIASAAEYVREKFGRLDVLINNAGFLLRSPDDDSLSALRRQYDRHLSAHLTSVAVIITAFKPLLHKAVNPKIITVSSGLGSIHNVLTKKMGRAPPYGSSKVGMNGVMMHMATMENDRVQAEKEKGNVLREGILKFYVVAPGVLKTAFTNDAPWAKDPKEGAQVVVRLVLDDKDEYPSSSYWEFERGEMRQVPW